MYTAQNGFKFKTSVSGTRLLLFRCEEPNRVYDRNKRTTVAVNEEKSTRRDPDAIGGNRNFHEGFVVVVNKEITIPLPSVY